LKFVPGRGLPAKHEIGSLQNLTGLFAIGQSLEQKAEKPLLHLILRKAPWAIKVILNIQVILIGRS
jgi:hypothetical protein